MDSQFCNGEIILVQYSQAMLATKEEIQKQDLLFHSYHALKHMCIVILLLFWINKQEHVESKYLEKQISCWMNYWIEIYHCSFANWYFSKVIQRQQFQHYSM